MGRRPFAPEDDRTIEALWAEGVPSDAMARRLGRSARAIRRRANFLGLRRQVDFSAGDDRTLRAMWGDGRSSVEIGARLKRTSASVRRRVGILGLDRRDAAETEHLARAGRAAALMRPLYSQSIADRIANIDGAFRRLCRRLDAWGLETDRLARDMGLTLAVVLVLFAAAVPAHAADQWHIWPAGSETHRKDLAGTRQPAGVLLRDFYAERVDGRRGFYVRAIDLDAAKVAVRGLAGNVEFTRQPFKRPPVNWIPNFYMTPACQYLRGIWWEDRC